MYTGLTLASDLLDEASAGRLTNWHSALSLWAEYPLLGIGYKALLPLYGFPGDNTFVLALAETGIAGLLAVTLLFGTFLARGRTLLKQGDPLGRVLLIVWIGQVAHAVNVDVITFPGSMTVIALLSVVAGQFARGPVDA
jgi:O-antigen ligase